MQPTSSTRKPRASSQARIAAILDAARGLLADEGIGGLTIYSVAERAEMPPSSVYHFFPSVPALLQGLTGEVHAAFRACLEQPVDHAGLRCCATCRGSSRSACWRSTPATRRPAN